jgi:hypothetical protein
MSCDTDSDRLVVAPQNVLCRVSSRGLETDKRYPGFVADATAYCAWPKLSLLVVRPCHLRALRRANLPYLGGEF